MQHPVGYRIDPETGNAVLTSIWALLTNSTAIFAYFHTIPAALTTAAALITGISIWQLGKRPGHEIEFFRRSARWGLRGLLTFSIATVLVGHFFGQLMGEQQPMKMAAAEALYESRSGAPLSLMAIGPFEKKPKRLSFRLEIPKLYSFMDTNSFSGHVEGIDDLQRADAKKYAAYERAHGRDPTKAEYYPIVGLNYWTFRIMVGIGIFLAALAATGLLLERRWRNGLAGLARTRAFRWAAIGGLFAGFLAHAAGWIFTEQGRQPWVVTGLLKTEDAVSKLGASTVAISLGVFIVLYCVIGAIEFWLFRRVADSDPEPLERDDDQTASVPSLAY
ncbi:Cytochrome d ubiquinol oxidase subunit I [Patulibacter medicamentivorans]|uniref:Cytochrome d ubiquinol oxidase subunit I n=2 Tax=Patulibacter medicamentivorans TaxID=1097667 RepID=H0EC38_9ACTN|nr:Cytochrome d ubiquinol oxidase subunit I [Patulibacter medicamentivorans]